MKESGDEGGKVERMSILEEDRRRERKESLAERERGKPERLLLPCT